MNARRLDGVQRGEAISITVDGEQVEAFQGESIAAAMLASGRRVFQHSPKDHAPRGLFCGMGICFSCAATVDGVPNVCTCQTAVHPGCVVETK